MKTWIAFSRFHRGGFGLAPVDGGGTGTRGQAAQGQGSGQSPMLFVVIGVGSVALLLLIGLLIAVLDARKGNGMAPCPRRRRAQVAEPLRAPQPIRRLRPRARRITTDLSAAVDVTRSSTHSSNR